MRVVRNIWLGALVTLLAVGCGSDKKSNGNSAVESTEISAPFLSSTDLSAPASSQSESDFAEVIDDLQNESFLYDVKPEEAETEAEKCFTEVSGFAKAHATTTSIKIGFTVDVTSCLQASAKETITDGSTLTLLSVVVNYYQEISCAAADFSSYEGKTLTQLRTEFDAEGAGCKGSFAKRANSKFLSTIESKNSGKVSSFTLEQTVFEGKSDGTACGGSVTDGDVRIDDGCLAIEKNVYSNAVYDGKNVEALPTFSKLTKKGIVNKKGDTPWFDAGTIDVLQEGWTGTITYTAGSTNPTYSLKAPGAITPKTGTLTPASKRSNLRLAPQGQAQKLVAPFAKFHSFGPSF